MRGDIVWADDDDAAAASSSSTANNAQTTPSYDDLVRPILECKLFEVKKKEIRIINVKIVFLLLIFFFLIKYDVRLQMLKFNGPNVKLAFDIDISYEPFVTGATKSSDDDDEDENDEKQNSGRYENDEEDNENDLDESRLVMILKSNREKIALTCQKVNSRDVFFFHFSI